MVSSTGAFLDTSSPSARAIALTLAGFRDTPPASTASIKSLAWRISGGIASRLRNGLNNQFGNTGFSARTSGPS